MGTGAPTAGRLRRARAALLSALGVRRVPPPSVDARLLRLCADLGRLDAEMGRLLVADPRTPALKARLQAASWAYDAVLREVCGLAGVPARDLTPFEPADRLLAEAGLVAAGVLW